MSLSREKQNIAKINLPRLKLANIHSLTAPNIQQKLRIQSLRTDKSIQAKTIEAKPITNFNQKINDIKYKYESRSPHYFKSKMNSVKTIHNIQQKSQTIQNYIEQHNKQFDRQMLLNIAKSKVRQTKIKKEQENKHAKEFSTRETVGYYIQKTNYDNFRPLKYPIKDSLRWIKHPDLTIVKN